MEAEFLALEGEFSIRQGTKLIDYTRISDIPEKFDHVIKFCPKIPEEPHDINDHIHINHFTDYLNMLQAREQM